MAIARANMNKSMTTEPMKRNKKAKRELPKNLDFSKLKPVKEDSEAANARMAEQSIEDSKKKKAKPFKKGGKVRGSGCAKRGVRPCKMR